MEIMPKTCSNLTKNILDKNQRNHPGVFISNSLFYTNCATFFIADFEHVCLLRQQHRFLCKKLQEEGECSGNLIFVFSL